MPARPTPEPEPGRRASLPIDSQGQTHTAGAVEALRAALVTEARSPARGAARTAEQTSRAVFGRGLDACTGSVAGSRSHQASALAVRISARRFVPTQAAAALPVAGPVETAASLGLAVLFGVAPRRGRPAGAPAVADAARAAVTLRIAPVGPAGAGPFAATDAAGLTRRVAGPVAAETVHAVSRRAVRGVEAGLATAPHAAPLRIADAIPRANLGLLHVEQGHAEA